MSSPIRHLGAAPLAWVAMLAAGLLCSAPAARADRPAIETELEGWLRQYYRDAWAWARTTRSGRVFAVVNVVHPSRTAATGDAAAWDLLEVLRDQVLRERAKDLDFADGTQVMVLGSQVSIGKERAETTRWVLRDLSHELVRVATANGLAVRSLAVESLELGRVSIRLGVRGVELGDLERERLEVGLWHAIQTLAGSARFGFLELDLELSAVEVEDLPLPEDAPGA